MKFILIVVFSIVGITVIYQIIRFRFIKLSKYSLKFKKLPSSFVGMKIMHITDLHGRVFGKDHSQILSIVKKEEPSYIFMTGDMAKNGFANVDSLHLLLKLLTKKYTVIYTLGNQEKKYSYTELEKFKSDLREMRVILLDNKVHRIYNGNEYINIHGMNFKWSMILEPKDESHRERNLRIIQNTMGSVDKDEFNIFLTHDTSNFEMYEKRGYDLIFAGHLHGGAIRLFGRGVLSPNRKFFPKYTKGIYTKNSSTMVANAGIAKPRVFNPPEVVCVILK